MNPTMPLPTDVRLMNWTASALIWIFAGMVLVALFSVLMRSPAFAIKTISVSGDVLHNNVPTLRANLAPKLSGSFLTLDLAKARDALEAVPWVRKAAVRREFPNQLKVILQEHQTAAYWGLESESRLLNTEGEIFEANVDEVGQDALPRLYGPNDQAKYLLSAYRLMQPAFAALDLELNQLELSERGGWQARLENGASLQLGRGNTQEILERVQLFLKTLTQVTARYGRNPDALESADLRHKDGYAVRLRGVTTTITPVAQK